MSRIHLGDLFIETTFIFRTNFTAVLEKQPSRFKDSDESERCKGVDLLQDHSKG